MKVSCCFLEYEGKIFTVARENPKTHILERDIPAAKVKGDELPEDMIVRILNKEAGFKTDVKELELIGTFNFISRKNKPYIMHTYRLNAIEPIPINLGNLPSQWISPKDCIARGNLIKNFDQLLRLSGYLS